MNEQLRTLLRELEAEDDPEPDAWDRSRAGWHRAFIEGKAEGQLEGKAEGQLEGRLQAKREALLDILEVLGFTLDDATHASVRSCSELSKLEAWIARAKRAGTLADVFEPGAEP